MSGLVAAVAAGDGAAGDRAEYAADDRARSAVAAAIASITIAIVPVVADRASEHRAGDSADCCTRRGIAVAIAVVAIIAAIAVAVRRIAVPVGRIAIAIGWVAIAESRVAVGITVRATDADRNHGPAAGISVAVIVVISVMVILRIGRRRGKCDQACSRQREHCSLEHR